MLVAHQNIAISAVWNILLFAPLDRYFWPQCALPLPLLLSVGYVCMSAAAGKQFNVARCMASKRLKPAQAVLCSPGVSVLSGPAAPCGTTGETTFQGGYDAGRGAAVTAAMTTLSRRATCPSGQSWPPAASRHAASARYHYYCTSRR